MQLGRGREALKNTMDRGKSNFSVMSVTIRESLHDVLLPKCPVSHSALLFNWVIKGDDIAS